jgi:hypothetical protein
VDQHLVRDPPVNGLVCLGDGWSNPRQIKPTNWYANCYQWGEIETEKEKQRNRGRERGRGRE